MAPVAISARRSQAAGPVLHAPGTHRSFVQQRRWTGAKLTIAWAASAILLPSLGAAPALADASPGQQAVDELNRLRRLAGLGPVTLDLGSAPQLHAHYLVVNKDSPAVAGLNVHTEQAGLPGYTPNGAAVAARSNIAISDGAESAIRGLVDVPLHRRAMLNPSLTRIGVGTEGRHWVIDVGSTPEQLGGQPKPVTYPGDGQRQLPVIFPGDEVPNPLTAVPGLDPKATVGYPITLDLWGCQPGNPQASLSAAGSSVPIYLIQPGTVVSAVGGQRTISSILVFPRRPLDPATTYTAQMSASCPGLGSRTYSWSFTTHAALDPSATTTAVSPAGADDWQQLTLLLVDTAHAPFAGARLTTWKWSYTSSVPNARKPEVRQHQSDSGSQGVVALDFRLGDARWLDLEVSIAYDGQTVTLPTVRLTPDSAGTSTVANPDEPGVRFPRDPEQDPPLADQFPTLPEAPPGQPPDEVDEAGDPEGEPAAVVDKQERLG